MSDPNQSTSEGQDQDLSSQEGVQGSQEGADTEEGADTPTPRTYSEEEWNKRQSSWDSQFETMRKQHRDELSKMTANYQGVLEQLRKQQSETFVRQTEEAGGDVNFARQLMSMQDEIYQRQREVDERTRQLDERAGQADEGLKILAAHKLAAQHGVDADELLKANNPDEMENMALKLALAKSREEQKKGVKTDKGTTSTKSADLSTLSGEGKIREGIKGMNL